MATILEALDLLASKKWWKDWQNPLLLKSFSEATVDLNEIPGKSAAQETEAADA